MAKKVTPKKAQNIRRINRFIKSAEKRGYIIPEELKGNLSTYSTQKLKSLTPQKIYEQSQYSLNKDLTISGERARKIERSVIAKKGWQTRREKEEEYIPEFSDIVLEELYSMIEDARASSWDKMVRNAYYVENALELEISIYGRDVVALSCEQAPDDIKAKCREALRSYDVEQCREYAIEMIMLIRSHILTIEQSKAMDVEPDIYDIDIE